jgi:hypothetical protein
MRINLNVKIEAGPRTPVSVEVCGTAVNEKILRFADGNEVRESDIASWLAKALRDKLETWPK